MHVQFIQMHTLLYLYFLYLICIFAQVSIDIINARTPHHVTTEIYTIQLIALWYATRSVCTVLRLYGQVIDCVIFRGIHCILAH